MFFQVAAVSRLVDAVAVPDRPLAVVLAGADPDHVGSLGSIVTHPIECEASPSKTGWNEVPAFTVLQTPPSARRRNHRLVRGIDGEVMTRPDVSAGPIERAFSPATPRLASAPMRRAAPAHRRPVERQRPPEPGPRDRRRVSCQHSPIVWTTRLQKTVGGILAALSVSAPAQRHHPVADPGGLPGAEDVVSPHLHADRADHARVPVTGVAAPAAGRPRTPTGVPMPYSLVAGMGRPLAGLLLLSVARRFPAMILLAAGLVGVGLVGVPPGGVADGAAGVRRPARACPVAVPGRRQRRARPSARCWPRSSWCRGAGEPRLVLGRGARSRW